MIGSSTLVVRKNNRFSVYIFGGLGLLFKVNEIEKKKDCKTLCFFKRFVANKKNKPATENLKESEASKILSSHQCASDLEANYSEFAGDGLFLLDLDKDKLVKREDFCANYEKNHPEEILAIKKDLRKRCRVARQQILRKAKEMESKIFDLMENPVPDKPEIEIRNGSAVEIHTVRDVRGPSEYEFKNGGRNITFWTQRLQKPHFDFIEWFINRNKKHLKMVVFYKKGWSSRSFPAFLTFEYADRTWAWNHMYNHSLEVVSKVSF